MCILTEENYAFVHSTDQKIVCIQAMLPTVACIIFKQERRIWSLTFSPPPLRQHLSTHTHTNKLMLRRNTN